MTPNLDKCFDRLLVIEGPFVNNPKDPGGATNMGVTQKTFDGYLAASGQAPYSVRHIRREQARTIFRVNYWTRIQADKLQHGWDWALADFAFHSGPGQAVKIAQRVLGLNDDGIMGPTTLAAIFNAPVSKLNELMDARLEFLKTLKNFKDAPGWVTRIKTVREQAVKDWGLTGR